MNGTDTTRTLILRPAAVLLLAATAAICQSQDVGGWTRIRWGMTINEAREAFPGQVSDPRIAAAPDAILMDRFLISNIQIGRITAEAAVQSERDSNQVVAIRLRAAGPSASPRERTNTFSALKQLLIVKYGAPQNEDHSPDGSGTTDSRVFWVFPSTSITLWWNEQTGGPGFVSIHYEAIDSKALDAL